MTSGNGSGSRNGNGQQDRDHTNGEGKGGGVGGIVGSGIVDAPEPDEEEDDDAPTLHPEPIEITEDDPTTQELPPQAVGELAAACQRFILGKYQVPLDFTSDTLSLVDQYVREARAEITLLPSSLDLIAAAVGAYLGEVVRRTFGGEWEAVGDHSTYRLFLSKVYMAFNPLGMGREALTMDPEDGWHSHLVLDPKERDFVDRRIAALPEVPEDEYYLPSTRFDVISVAFDALRGKMIDRGDAGVRFIRRDYR
jgi:hypothetical protein